MTHTDMQDIADFAALWHVRVTITVDGVVLRMQRQDRVVKRIIAFVDLCTARYPLQAFQAHVGIMDRELGA